MASDAAGVRRVLKSVEESKKKNLLVAIGLQRRHEPSYIETIKRIHDGAIGDVICTRVYWNGGGIWHRERREGMTEMAYQTNNWYHFNWLSGDQICEQHIHNLDVGCWLNNAYPVECNGMGGGEQRMGGDRRKSQIFDHTFCEYTFADGTKMYSQGRHLEGGWATLASSPMVRRALRIHQVGSRARTLGNTRVHVPTAMLKSNWIWSPHFKLARFTTKVSTVRSRLSARFSAAKPATLAKS